MKKVTVHHIHHVLNGLELPQSHFGANRTIITYLCYIRLASARFGYFVWHGYGRVYTCIYIYLNSRTKLETLVWRLMKGLARN